MKQTEYSGVFCVCEQYSDMVCVCIQIKTQSVAWITKPTGKTFEVEVTAASGLSVWMLALTVPQLQLYHSR